MERTVEPNQAFDSVLLHSPVDDHLGFPPKESPGLSYGLSSSLYCDTSPLSAGSQHDSRLPSDILNLLQTILVEGDIQLLSLEQLDTLIAFLTRQREALISKLQPQLCPDFDRGSPYDQHEQDTCPTRPPASPADCEIGEYNFSSDGVALFATWSNSSSNDGETARPRGRALQMHEKFSSPSRKRSPSESFKRHEEKFAKAQEARERYLEEKSQRFKDIARKMEEMKALKEEQQQQKKKSIEIKLQRAEELRKEQLKKIVKKAHDEESKVNEIQFINTLEAENKRHEILTKEKDSEARLQDLHEERQRKQEEKAAKEAAAEERRKALEAERQARLEEMQQRRKLKDKKIEQQMQEKEKERQELASQKARDREQKLSAINAAHLANVEELQKKIQQKQEESKRRHQENMDHIRQKAFELSVCRFSAVSNSDDAPGSVPYEVQKMCSLCNVLIGSEVYLYSHLRGEKHQAAIKVQHSGEVPSSKELECYNLKYIVDAPPGINAGDLNPELAEFDKERLKAIKKRCKKLKQRMVAGSRNFESEWKEKHPPPAANKNLKLAKLLKDTSNLSSDTCITGPWPSNMVHTLDRNVSELERLISRNATEAWTFAALGGLHTLNALLNRLLDGTKEKPTSFSPKIFVHICNLLELICLNDVEISRYVFYSTIITCNLNQLAHRLNLLIIDGTGCIMSNSSDNRKYDIVVGALSKLLAGVLDIVSVSSACKSHAEFSQRVQDVISYTVSVGIVDKLSLCISNAQGPIDTEPELAQFLQHTLSFVTALIKLFATQRTRESLFDGSKLEDSSQFVATLKMTQISGVISLVYGMLLNVGSSSRNEFSPKEAASHTLDVTLECFRLLNHFALVDLEMLQAILGSEGLSLQLRHISSYLLRYCSHWKTSILLHELLLLLGYFTVLHPDNQKVIHSGQRPTILEQLCSQPFEYFSDPSLSRILFPTLISCCSNNKENKAILEQEMSSLMLSSFIESTVVQVQLEAVSKKTVPSRTYGQLAASEDDRWSLLMRYPKNRWLEAKKFFETES